MQINGKKPLLTKFMRKSMLAYVSAGIFATCQAVATDRLKPTSELPVCKVAVTPFASARLPWLFDAEGLPKPVTSALFDGAVEPEFITSAIPWQRLKKMHSDGDIDILLLTVKGLGLQSVYSDPVYNVTSNLVTAEPEKPVKKDATIYYASDEQLLKLSEDSGLEFIRLSRKRYLSALLGGKADAVVVDSDLMLDEASVTIDDLTLYKVPDWELSEFGIHLAISEASNCKSRLAAINAAITKWKSRGFANTLRQASNTLIRARFGKLLSERKQGKE